MDHLIEYIIHYMWSDKEQLRAEWQSRGYKTPSECPTYSLVKAYCRAIEALDMAGEYGEITPEKLLEEE